MTAPSHATLRGSAGAVLAERHDVALLDLDGVVYLGQQAVPGVPQALSAVRRAGMRLAFVTNNAARPPQTVADHLRRLGVEASRDDVITSAQAAAHYLAERLPAGASVLVVGTVGLVEALRERGLEPVERDSDAVAAVVQGFSPELSWPQLAEGALAIRRGVPWVATNVDPTVPSPRGSLPGNGSLVAALRTATGAVPVVTGKPDPTMHRETVERSGAANPVVVGDRLDTDIEGANAVGCASLLVLSGVTAVADLLTAPPELRPTYLGVDAGALLQIHPQPALLPGGTTATAAHCGRWLAEVADASVRLRRRSIPSDTAVGDAAATGDGVGPCPDRDDGALDSMDALRAACQLVWARHAERPAGPPRIKAGDEHAGVLLAQWRLG